MPKAKSSSEQKRPKKLFLTKEETSEVQSRREVAYYIHNLLMRDIQNYLVDTAFKRLNIPTMAEVRVSDDAMYLEIKEDGDETAPASTS